LTGLQHFPEHFDLFLFLVYRTLSKNIFFFNCKNFINYFEKFQIGLFAFGHIFFKTDNFGIAFEFAVFIRRTIGLIGNKLIFLVVVSLL